MFPFRLQLVKDIFGQVSTARYIQNRSTDLIGLITKYVCSQSSVFISVSAYTEGVA